MKKRRNYFLFYFLFYFLYSDVNALKINFDLKTTYLDENQEIKQKYTKETLKITEDRFKIIQQRGFITESLEKDISNWINNLKKPQEAQFYKIGEVNSTNNDFLLSHRNGFELDKQKIEEILLEIIQNPQEYEDNSFNNANINIQDNEIFINLDESFIINEFKPKKEIDFFIKKGITHYISTGSTSFLGSSENRLTNIKIGTSFFENALFNKKIFSFNDFIGLINKNKGYVDGLIITDKTESGLGGGICQVSTTVFRALYEAGFEIKERHTHSYKVPYYEPKGYDAAIYQLTLDLKFKIDYSIWFQTEIENDNLKIHVFGKKPEFEIKISEPREKTTIKPPKDKIIFTDKLPKGEKRQIDLAATGGTLEIDRIFYKNNKEVKRDTLKSTYKPWPNIFLVGK